VERLGIERREGERCGNQVEAGRDIAKLGAMLIEFGEF
jgi:hypothetical protein